MYFDYVCKIGGDYMKSIKKTILKLTLSLVLAFGLIASLPLSTGSINAQDTVNTVDIQTTTNYNADNTEASIIFDVDSFQNKIVNVKDLNGQIIQAGANHEYVVNQNGNYDFTITYMDNNNKETSFVKTIKIDKIGTNGTNSATAWRSSLLRTSVTDGGATIDIPDYDGIGWNTFSGSLEEAKKVSFTINFGDTSSSGKKATITIPDGMRITNLEVVGSKSLYPNTDHGILSVYEESNPLAKQITSMTVPGVEKDFRNGTFGEVTYEFAPGIEVAVINMILVVDTQKYYGPKDLGSISLEVEKNGASIGSVEQQISAVGAAVPMVVQYFPSATTTTSSKLLSSPDENNLTQGRTPPQRFDWYNYGNGRIAFVRDAVHYVHYPIGMEYVSGSVANRFEVSNVDEENNRVKFTLIDDGQPRNVFNSTRGSQIQVNYQVPVGTAPGIYEIPTADYVELTMYDGIVVTRTVTNNKYAVEIVDEFKNQLTKVSNGSGYVFDNTGVSEHSTFVGAMQFKNDTGAVVTDQVFEMIVEPAFKTTSVYIPKGNEEISNVVYKTNLNSNERSYVGTFSSYSRRAGEPSSDNYNRLTRKMLSLEDGEYITYVRADMGSFDNGYMMDINYAQINRIVIYGSLAKGETSANLTYNMYDKNNPATNIITQSNDIVGKVTTVFQHLNSGGFNTKIINAGQKYTVSGSMSARVDMITQVNQGALIHNPKFYYVEEVNRFLDVDNILFWNDRGQAVNFTYETRDLDDGRKLYSFDFDQEYIGAYDFDDFATAREYAIYFRFDVNTSIKASGTDQAVNVFWGGDNPTSGGFAPGIDVNQDGVADERFFSPLAPSALVTINKNNNVLVETGLSVEGEPSLPSYVVGNEGTIARFTPGTNADLKVEVLNNDDVPANDTTVYIPIPKTGVDFGDHFQTEAFTWDMTLKAAVPTVNGAEVSYSTDSAPGKYLDGEATYSTTLPANLSEVTMIKITSTEPIPVGASAVFRVPLLVDETFDSATAEGKVGKLNVFYPAYYVDSTNYVGRLSGTTVATELIITSIGGTIFEDMDANGLYDASVDEVMPGQTVELYVLNETTGLYEPVMDGTDHVTAVSDADGVYLFPSSLNLPNETYAIKFIEKAGSVYQYTKQNVSAATADKLIDSDAIMFNDIPNPGDTYRGWVLDIDATRSEAKTIGVGFLQYDPPADLKVTINDTPNEVKVGETIVVGTEISPTYFDEIKHLDTPYAWSIVGGTTDAATLIDNGDGTVTIVPSDSVTGTTTIDIEITIMDIYGGVATSEVATITIVSDTPPTITADDVVVYVGDSVSEILANANVSAVDNSGADITVVFTAGAAMNASYEHTAPNDGSVFTEPGTYSVTYTVTDKWGNEATLTKVVKVNEGPVVTSYGSQYVLGTAEADIIADITTDVNATWLKAPDAVGEAVETTIATPANTTGGNDTIKYELDASNPSSDFSVTGIYKVNYTATNPDGKTATTTKYILITSTEVEANEAGLMISAEGFMVEQADKAAFTEEISKDADHGKVEAYKAIKDADGNVTSYVDLTKDAYLKNFDVVSKVNNAPETGGIYPATYEIMDIDGSADVTVAIVVNGTNIVTENGISIYADSFVIENAEAAGMDDAKVIEHGNVVAVRNEDSSFITDITSDSAQLDVIKSVNAGGGIFPLGLTANDVDNTASKDIKVTVKGYNVNVENGISIYAESFRIPNAEAAGLDSETALTTSNAHAINSVTGVDLTDLSVNEEELAAINAATSRGGIFKLTVYANEDDRTAEKVIYVTVDGTQVVVGDLTIVAEGFSVSQTEAKALDEDMAKELSNVFALDTATGQPVTNIKANPDDIEKINNDSGTGGVYELTFTATNEAGDTVSTTIFVTVEGSNVTVRNGIAIEAYGFTVPYKESLTLTREDILERSKAKAWYVVDYKMIDTLDIDLGHLNNIHEGPKTGGVYDVKTQVETDSLTRNADEVATMVPVTVIGEDEKDLPQTGFNANGMLLSIILASLLGVVSIFKRKSTKN